MKKLKLEYNCGEEKSNDIIKVGNVQVMFTPNISEEYWVFRIKLFKDQSLLAFRKFTTLGIGFAQEEDWNTNLPYNCDANQIYDHIKINKKYKQITKTMCIEAIKLLQEASISLKKKEEFIKIAETKANFICYPNENSKSFKSKN